MVPAQPGVDACDKCAMMAAFWLSVGDRRAVYFGFAAGLTKARPLGPVPLTWITTGSRTSTKCGMFAGSV
jgi:hypothetical protein